MNYQYSLNTKTLGPQYPLLEKLSAAHSAGYTAVEIWYDDIDIHLGAGETLDSLRRALDDMQLKALNLIGFPAWLDATPEMWEQKLVEARRKMEIVVGLGADTMNAGVGGRAVPLDQMAERCRALVDLARSIGCMPAFEFISHFEQVSNPAIMKEILTLAGCPEAPVIVDVMHVWNGQGSINDLAALSADQIPLVHMDDIPAGSVKGNVIDSSRILPGEGIIPIVEILEKLASIGWHKYLSLEMFNPQLWDMQPRDVARLGLRRMQEVAAKVKGNL